MKKFICFILVGCFLTSVPAFSAPDRHHSGGGNRPNMSRPTGGAHRPPSHSMHGNRPMYGGAMRPASVGQIPMNGRMNKPVSPIVNGPKRPHMNGRPPMMGNLPPRPVGHVRPLPPPVYRPIYRPYYYRPYYSYYYYTYPTTYTTYYSYYPYTDYMTEAAGVTPVASEIGTVVVRDNYAGINTAANVINTAANVAATIKYLSW